MYDLFAAMFSPAAFAHAHLFVHFHLEEILANNSSQNGENRVAGRTLNQAPCTHNIIDFDLFLIILSEYYCKWGVLRLK